MNDDLSHLGPGGDSQRLDVAALSLGSSTLYNLLEAMIQLAERNQREHKVFSQDLKGVRDSLQGSFNNFAAETQKAYQQMRKEIQTFVHKVTRLEGEFVGRWGGRVCPMVVGVSEAQSEFIKHRIVEVQDRARRKKSDPDAKCQPNLFVIVTDDADQVLADWKQRDPGMFRWKSRENVSRSAGPGPVKTWHNAILTGSDGRAVNEASMLSGRGNPANAQVTTGSRLNVEAPSCPATGRIEAGCWEHINAVVVLVDARQTGKVTISQLADYISVVSLSQIDLTADLGGVDSILRLYGRPPAEVPPAGITEWDHAFLNGLYRASYSPKNQQRDIAARMVRELAPR